MAVITDIADAIVWAAGGTVTGVPANATPARVISLSLGGAGSCDTTTQNAISQARAKGAVVVVAAGNDNADASRTTPANCSGVVAVAATNASGGRASYSNTGVNVALAAPGGDGGNGIVSTLNAGTSVLFSTRSNTGATGVVASFIVIAAVTVIAVLISTWRLRNLNLE